MSEYKYEARLLDAPEDPSSWTNITEDLAMLYDLVVGSMDWGSGFLEDQEMEAVVKIGVLCGFDVPTCTANWSKYSDDKTQVAVNEYGQCKKPMFHSGGHAGAVNRRTGEWRTPGVKIETFDHEWEAEHKEGGK